MVISNNLINQLKQLVMENDERLAPAIVFPDDLYDYNFGRKIGKAPRLFWEQYKNFVEHMDGINIDGCRIYGIENHFNYENDLFTFNGFLTKIACEAPDTMIAEDFYCIEIGGSSLDTYTYDIRSNKWESRDQQQYQNLFISCDTLAEFLQAVLDDIRQHE
ncbi:hypothetical protein B1H58_18460 [Pantoea alhagi]|uniref:SMI1/KNR4 family protein n=1 Tax=Pantoea alhagi TaxID=1891675 RepID=A0A1W6B9T7_9GAMM|nr:YrhA family protein [Pantoea alhagi]ARJ43834.1 hypothetical protein B1H58_18460 [Pantoea alhagi]